MKQNFSIQWLTHEVCTHGVLVTNEQKEDKKLESRVVEQYDCKGCNFMVESEKFEKSFQAGLR